MQVGKVENVLELKRRTECFCDVFKIYLHPAVNFKLRSCVMTSMDFNFGNNYKLIDYFVLVLLQSLNLCKFISYLHHIPCLELGEMVQLGTPGKHIYIYV